MLRRSRFLLSLPSVNWPIDSRLPQDRTVKSSITSSSIPLSRAKATWLLNRGAIDGDIAVSLIQSSASWAAACAALVKSCGLSNSENSSSNRQQQNENVDDGEFAQLSLLLTPQQQMTQDLLNSGDAKTLLRHSNNGNSKTIISAPLVEALTHRLIQEVRHHNIIGVATSALSTINRVPEFYSQNLDDVYQVQIEQALNEVAATEVDAEPKDAWIQRQEEGENDEEDGRGDEIEENKKETEEDDDDEDMLGNTANSSSKIADSSFSLTLFKANTGTLTNVDTGDVLVRKIINFCEDQNVPKSPTIYSQLALLPMSSATALSLVDNADRTLVCGAPTSVIESAMRCLLYDARFNDATNSKNILYNSTSHEQVSSASQVLKLYYQRLRNNSNDSNNEKEEETSDSLSPIAISYALNALTIHQLAVDKILATRKIKNNKDHSSPHPFTRETELTSILGKSTWQWTLLLHQDIASSSSSSSWFMSGDYGRNLISSATRAAASIGNWDLALQIMSKNNVLAQYNENNNGAASPQALIVPDADSFAMTIAVCAANGRFEQARELIKIGGDLLKLEKQTNKSRTTTKKDIREKQEQGDDEFAEIFQQEAEAQKNKELSLDEFSKMKNSSSRNTIENPFCGVSVAGPALAAAIYKAFARQSSSLDAVSNGENKEKVGTSTMEEVAASDQNKNSEITREEDEFESIFREFAEFGEDEIDGDSSSFLLRSNRNTRTDNLLSENQEPQFSSNDDDEQTHEQKGIIIPSASSSLASFADPKAIFRCLLPIFNSMPQYLSLWTQIHAKAVASFAEKGFLAVTSSSAVKIFSPGQKEILQAAASLAEIALNEHLQLSEGVSFHMILQCGTVIMTNGGIVKEEFKSEKDTNNTHHDNDGDENASAKFLSRFENGGDIHRLLVDQILDVIQGSEEVFTTKLRKIAQEIIVSAQTSQPNLFWKINGLLLEKDDESKKRTPLAAVREQRVAATKEICEKIYQLRSLPFVIVYFSTFCRRLNENLALMHNVLDDKFKVAFESANGETKTIRSLSSLFSVSTNVRTDEINCDNNNNNNTKKTVRIDEYFVTFEHRNYSIKLILVATEKLFDQIHQFQLNQYDKNLTATLDDCAASENVVDSGIQIFNKVQRKLVGLFDRDQSNSLLSGTTTLARSLLACKISHLKMYFKFVDAASFNDVLDSVFFLYNNQIEGTVTNHREQLDILILNQIRNSSEYYSATGKPAAMSPRVSKATEWVVRYLTQHHHDQFPTKLEVYQEMMKRLPEEIERKVNNNDNNGVEEKAENDLVGESGVEQSEVKETVKPKAKILKPTTSSFETGY